MLQRAFTVFIALVLFWSAFATQEGPLAAGRGDTVVAASDPATGGGSAPGSVEAHHLDDQPGQAAAEPGADAPDWITAPRAPAPPVMVHGKPASGPAAAAVASAPDAPQRPPRA